ncbi:MAG: excinuclease ABC subunit UvrC [Thermoleophilia bacterium]|nr:excinuclease ABC subunit UvrC [Thermoleophilia bacterium]
MNERDELLRQLREAPNLPGVYLFRDVQASVLYVGKALSLRRRLANYLPAVRREEGPRAAAKAVEMAQRATEVEWIVASTEVEALLLEDNLIKRHRPPFNIRLRDDKSYPYIVITMEDEFPRVMFTRKPHRRGNLYFGPYASAAKVRETLDTLGRIFPFRKCRGTTPGRRSGSPCLQYHIKRCNAPCVGYIDRVDYAAIIGRVVDFLSGRHVEVAGTLEAEMHGAAGELDFERAALYRNRLEALRHVLERQLVRSNVLAAVDIIGMALGAGSANIQVFLTRDGILGDRRSFTLENIGLAGPREVFVRFLGEYYASATVVPPEIVVPRIVDRLEELAGFLEGLRGTRVDVRQAERGDRRRLQELADRNAELALEHDRLREERTRERRYGALHALRDALGLEGPPLRIEGYDISNLGPESIVASMVVFEGGAPRKGDYRKFALKAAAGQDDVGSIREAVMRRFSRATGVADPREYDPSFESVPDLVLIDGGKGQLGGALSALEEVGLDEVVPVISLAKREEEVFMPGRSEPLRLQRDDPALLLLQRVRDEAHRFAVAFHRTRRAGRATESLLDDLPGVGEKRKRAILAHFGSPERFLAAGREELEAVPGLPGKVAREIHAYLHKTG